MENIFNFAAPEALIATNLDHLTDLLHTSTIGGSSLMITSSYQPSTGELSKYNPSSPNKMVVVLALDNGKPNRINLIKFEGDSFGENKAQVPSEDEITAMISVLKLVHGDRWNSPENIKDLRVKFGQTTVGHNLISAELSRVQLV